MQWILQNSKVQEESQNVSTKLSKKIRTQNKL
jgi:hypothetical protein